MFGPNTLWHSLAGRVSEESAKGREQQERVGDGMGREGKHNKGEIFIITH